MWGIRAPKPEKAEFERFRHCKGVCRWLKVPIVAAMLSVPYMKKRLGLVVKPPHCLPC